ncbi:transposase [Streptomyces massasporeus]|uniref:transposase n=1 Tax=Streptomyces massasporeus TaxID=67324 RepID=UPI003820F7AA
MGAGRRWPGCRRLMNGVRWRVRTGVPWRDLPFECGPWRTGQGLFRRWQHRVCGPGRRRSRRRGLMRRADLSGGRCRLHHLPGMRSNAGSAVSPGTGPWRPGAMNLRCGSKRRFRPRRFISGGEPSACPRPDATAGKDGPAFLTEDRAHFLASGGAVDVGLHLP